MRNLITTLILMLNFAYAQDFTTIASCLTRGKTGLELIKTKNGKVFLRELENGKVFEKRLVKKDKDYTITYFSNEKELIKTIKSHDLIRHAVSRYTGSYDNVKKVLIAGSTYQIWVTLLDLNNNHVYGAILAQGHILECTSENSFSQTTTTEI